MFPNQENTFLFLFLYLCYREDRMRLGIAKLEKLRFSFVSALAFRYLCNTNLMSRDEKLLDSYHNRYAVVLALPVILLDGKIPAAGYRERTFQ